MEVHARAPDPLTKTADMASNWQSWKEDFIIFMKVTGYIDKPNDIRANLLKNRIGKVGIEAIQNISFDNIQDKDDMDILIEKLERYFNPPKKEQVERFNFFTRSKKQNESIEQYINILKEKAKTCNFNDITDTIIRDKIILDTHDKILRKKFFEADNLDLPKLVAIYNDYNINTEKMKQVTKENKTEPTPKPSKQVPKENKTEPTPKPSKQVTKENKAEPVPKPPDNNDKKGCWRCGHQHPQGKCPAWGSKCTRCGDVNHFTQCCKGLKFKMNDDKVNKNLLDPMQQAKLTPKNNDKWNNQADPMIKATASTNKMTSFPDIPTTQLCQDNTTNHSAHLPENTQCSSYSFTKGIKPDGIATNLHNKGENVQSKPKQIMKTCIDTSLVRDNSKQSVKTHNCASHSTLKFKNVRKKKSDEDACILSLFGILVDICF